MCAGVNSVSHMMLQPGASDVYSKINANQAAKTALEHFKTWLPCLYATIQHFFLFQTVLPEDYITQRRTNGSQLVLRLLKVIAKSDPVIQLMQGNNRIVILG